MPAEATTDLGILGTGTVGLTLATAFAAAGSTVTVGSRTADNAAATAWLADVAGEDCGIGTFATAAARGSLLINATGGMVSLDVLATCDPADLAGKVLIDVANPLDFSAGFPPTLSVCNTDSLAEQIQRAHPELRVVKALSTMAVQVMVAPSAVPGHHIVPAATDDEAALGAVVALLAQLGWAADQVVHLGGLDAARGLEMWLPLWLRLYGVNGHPMFNLAVPAQEGGGPRG